MARKEITVVITKKIDFKAKSPSFTQPRQSRKHREWVRALLSQLHEGLQPHAQATGHILNILTVVVYAKIYKPLTAIIMQISQRHQGLEFVILKYI